MKVSLVATVKDARPHIDEFLASVERQTRHPDEVVVVDGGSTDGTWEAVSSRVGVMALLEPGANIARGRNAAIRAATHEVIAVTDGDCVLAPDWLERILEPLERGTDVAAGFYRPIAESFLQVCAAAATLPDEDELSSGWMPSSRSIAFRRETFESAGRYPEWLDVGEDMYFNHRLRDRGARMELAPRAVAYWRMRPTLGATWRQYVGYAFGDGVSLMYPHRHLLRFATYGFLVATLARRRPWMVAAAGAGSIAYARRPLDRARRRIPAGSPDRLKAMAAVPALMAFIDAAKMWGYIRGLAARGQRNR